MYDKIYKMRELFSDEPWSNKFSKKRILGNGAFGKVYEVLEIETNKKFAMKEIVTNEANAEQAKQEMIMMDIITKSCSNSNNFCPMLKLHSCYKTEEKSNDKIISVTLFVVMEIGIEIENWLVEKGVLYALSPIVNGYTKASIACDIISGVQYLHKLNIVHGDLKPDNMIVVDDKIKLSDFGLSCCVTDVCSKKCDFRGGTPKYMDPMMLFKGVNINKTCDVYSLGVILFELFTETTYCSSRQTETEVIENYNYKYKYYTDNTKLFHDDDEWKEIVFNMLHPFDSNSRINLEKITINKSKIVITGTDKVDHHDAVKIPVTPEVLTTIAKDIVRNAMRVNIELMDTSSVNSANIKVERNVVQDKMQTFELTGELQKILQDPNEIAKLAKEARQTGGGYKGYIAQKNKTIKIGKKQQCVYMKSGNLYVRMKGLMMPVKAAMLIQRSYKKK